MFHNEKYWCKKKYFLIYAIATPALQAAAAATQDLPIIGCAVTDYESTKLVDSNDKPGGNVTGASDLTPVAAQFDLLTELLPDAKKVAIMYCGSEDNSIIQGNLAVEAAKAKGLAPSKILMKLRVEKFHQLD